MLSKAVILFPLVKFQINLKSIRKKCYVTEEMVKRGL